MTYPLGFFVGGFRWSGSGAVSDWLTGNKSLRQIELSEAAFGEIRALNYGLKYSALTAAGQIPWGERLGRWALCPDPSLWNDILGPLLAFERGTAAPVYYAADILFTALARFKIIPAFALYKPMLDAQLNGDFRFNTQYIKAIAQFMQSLRSYMASQKGSQNPVLPWECAAVREAASTIVGIFYETLRKDGAVPIFDNTFSGINPELFKLLTPELFAKRTFILVRRDPRDQFADLVRFSGSTFSWSVNSFIRQYRKAQEKTGIFLESLKSEPDTFTRLINFESFVFDSHGTRTQLKNDLQDFCNFPDMRQNWNSEGSFNAAQSAKNIGFWRNSGLKSAMQKITHNLSEFLVEEAD